MIWQDLGGTMKYFKTSQDYPTVGEEILPLGELWCYISSSFLNGFLNYAKPIKAYAINRYTPREDNELLVQKFNSGRTRLHTKMGQIFDDDVLILSKNELGEYWFFWCDCDVSDCCIGRFTTSDSEEEVIAEFDRYVKERQSNLGYQETPGEAFELNVKHFIGWISFF